MKRIVLVAVVLVLLGTPMLYAQTFGTWTASASNPQFQSALTQNDSANILGQFCYLESGYCVWLLALRTGCEQGARYPVLINSDFGSASTQVYCDGPLQTDIPKLRGLFRYVFTDFDTVTNSVVKSQRIGFAFPLLGDQFSVVRFDLTGALPALRAMRASAANKIQPGRRGTLDEKL